MFTQLQECLLAEDVSDVDQRTYPLADLHLMEYFDECTSVKVH